MEIEINTAEGVERSDALDTHIRTQLERVARHHGECLTQTRVFLKDVNSGKGGVDTSCQMEARAAGLAPIGVEAMDVDAYRATGDAADKLDRALERRIGRRSDRS